MFRTIITIALITVTSVLASATAAKATDPQFCMYENPKKPGENLRYRGNFRKNYPPNAPGCRIISEDFPNIGGTSIIAWPDGVTTKITIRTKGLKRNTPLLTGIATVDGELADWSALEVFCVTIRTNQKKICY
jgi:hypothetical protein